MKELCGWSPESKKTTRMHVILGFPNHDHIDRNELNNCRSNLRQATVQEQIWNRSKAKGKSSNVVGVSYYSKIGKWVAELSYNRKRVFRQFFKTEEEAIQYVENINRNFPDLLKTCNLVIQETSTQKGKKK